jgi:hypothetical protein
MSMPKILVAGVALAFLVPVGGSGSPPDPNGSGPPPSPAPCQISAQEHRCNVETALEEIATVGRLGATAATAVLGLEGGKCEADSAGVKPDTKDQTPLGDCASSGANDAARDVCRDAIDAVWKACKAACEDFRKRGEDGEPTFDSKCARDNRRSTTAAGPASRVPQGTQQQPKCKVSCTATIACVCDP